MGARLAGRDALCELRDLDVSGQLRRARHLPAYIGPVSSRSRERDPLPDADAWATTLMVLGPEQGLAVAEAQNLAVYLLVKTDAGIEAKHSKAFAMYLPHPLQ